MASTPITQTFPILFVSAVTGSAEEDTAREQSLCTLYNERHFACASDTTCSPGSASDRGTDSTTDVSDNESSVACKLPVAKANFRWADYDEDDDDFLSEVQLPCGPPPEYVTDDEDFYWEANKCPDVQVPRPIDPVRTPLKTCASGFVPHSLAGATPLRARASGFMPQCMARNATMNTKLDFGNILAAGLMSMRSSPIVASAEVQEDLGGGCTLTAWLRTDVEDQFTAIKTITKRVQLALLHAAEVSEGSYLIGYEAEPFQPLGLGFSLLLASVADDTVACWDYIGKGICARGCRCRWEHPTAQMKIDIRIRLGVG